MDIIFPIIGGDLPNTIYELESYHIIKKIGIFLQDFSLAADARDEEKSLIKFLSDYKFSCDEIKWKELYDFHKNIKKSVHFISYCSSLSSFYTTHELTIIYNKIIEKGKKFSNHSLKIKQEIDKSLLPHIRDYKIDNILNIG